MALVATSRRMTIRQNPCAVNPGYRPGGRFFLRTSSEAIGTRKTEGEAFKAAKQAAKSRKEYVTVEDSETGQRWRFDPKGGQGGVNPSACAVTLKDSVTDRAKRYRANQEGCLPTGAKRCAICSSTRFLTVDHKDGNESNGAKSNLRWLCKSCNTRLGARDAKQGRGRRTQQYNPKGGAVSFEQWSEAVSTLAGENLGSMTLDQARDIVRATSKRRRSEFQEDVWRIRKERYGPSGRKDGGAGTQEEVPF